MPQAQLRLSLYRGLVRSLWFSELRGKLPSALLIEARSPALSLSAEDALMCVRTTPLTGFPRSLPLGQSRFQGKP